jgi:hypothetical protein
LINRYKDFVKTEKVMNYVPTPFTGIPLPAKIVLAVTR